MEHCTDAVDGSVWVGGWRSRRELCQLPVQHYDLSPILFVGVALGVQVLEGAIDRNMPLLTTAETSSFACQGCSLLICEFAQAGGLS